MVAVILQVIPSFYKSLFVCASTYGKYIVSKEYCIARHINQMFFLPNCRYHFKLIANKKELQQKVVDAFCFNYQHMKCLYILFKKRFSGKIIVNSGKIFDNLQRAISFNHQNRGVDRIPSIAKKRLLRKKYRRYLLSMFQKTKLTQTSGSVYADRIEQGKKKQNSN